MTPPPLPLPSLEPPPLLDPFPLSLAYRTLPPSPLPSPLSFLLHLESPFLPLLSLFLSPTSHHASGSPIQLTSIFSVSFRRLLPFLFHSAYSSFPSVLNLSPPPSSIFLLIPLIPPSSTFPSPPGPSTPHAGIQASHSTVIHLPFHTRPALHPETPRTPRRRRGREGLGIGSPEALRGLPGASGCACSRAWYASVCLR